jgi:hypothetical protein
MQSAALRNVTAEREDPLQFARLNPEEQRSGASRIARRPADQRDQMSLCSPFSPWTMVA